MNVAIRVSLQQSLDAAIRPEGEWTACLNSPEETRDDGIAGDVLGNILPGMVSSHLFLMNGLLTNKAKDVGM